MLPAPCYIISDIHLGAAPPATERALLAFLRSVRHDARALVVNGDLFDFWFEWRRVIPRAGFRTLATLADLADAGVEILWMAGNHDCWGGEVLRRDVGVNYHVGRWQGEIGGWRAIVDHGDGLRPREDRGYRRLRSVIRHPLAVSAFRLLHPDLGSTLASGSSEASRNYRPPDNGAGLRAIGLGTLEANPELDLVVFGHSHVPWLERAPGGGAYANAGTWLGDSTYLRLDPARLALCRWPAEAGASPEGDRLHVLDRRPQEAPAEG